MSEIKKAFSKLDNVKMPEDKKQEIFERIMQRNQSANRTRKTLFSVIVPAAAALMIAAAFLLPKAFAPSAADDMVIIPRPEDSANHGWINSTDSNEIVSTIVLSLNPVVKFGLGADGTVVEVEGLDEDGQRLLAGIDCGGLSLENATIVVVNQLLLNDYIGSDVDTEEITVSLESDLIDINSLSVMTQTIETAAKRHNIEVNVTPSEENQQLSIKLTGEEHGQADRIGRSEDVTAEFKLDADDPGTVDSVFAYTQDNDRLITSTNFSGMPFKEAVLYGLNDLIDNGYINDKNTGAMIIKLNTSDQTKAANLKYLAELIASQAGLKLKALSIDNGAFELVVSDTAETEEPKLTMSKILDTAVHKTKDDLTKAQTDILEFVFTEEQIEELLAIRYWVVVPNLVGLDEEKAVKMLEQMGIIPIVSREYNEQYSEFEEGTVFFQDFYAGAMLEKGERLQVRVMDDRFGPLGEGWTLSVFEHSNTGGDAAIETEYAVYDSGTKTLYAIITNNSETGELEYDTSFILERLYDGEWYSAVCTDCFEPATKTLLPNKTTGEKIDLPFAGSLEDGHYRIVKQLGAIKYAAEFDIEKGGYSSAILSGYVMLEDLPQQYTPELAAQNGDFIKDVSGSVYNGDKLVSFLEKSARKLPCKVRRTTFSSDGGAVIEDIVYNGRFFEVITDTSRSTAPLQTQKLRFSYISLGYLNGTTNVILTNTYRKLPLSDEYLNTDSFVLLHDTAVTAGADVTAIVIDMIDENAPLKVFSPDGKKYVSYTDGKKTVSYEVNAEKQYAGGIILPEDRGEAAKMVSLEWRDEDIVLITYKTDDGEFVRIAFNVATEAVTELTAEEQKALETAEQDYFTDADEALLLEKFAADAHEFVFTVRENGRTIVYSASANEASVKEQVSDGTEPVVSVIEWNGQKWNEFLKDIIACNVYEYKRIYEDDPMQEATGTEWKLLINGSELQVLSFGSGGFPQAYTSMLEVLEVYFKSLES